MRGLEKQVSQLCRHAVTKVGAALCRGEPACYPHTLGLQPRKMHVQGCAWEGSVAECARANVQMSSFGQVPFLRADFHIYAFIAVALLGCVCQIVAASSGAEEKPIEITGMESKSDVWYIHGVCVYT